MGDMTCEKASETSGRVPVGELNWKQVPLMGTSTEPGGAADGRNVASAGSATEEVVEAEGLGEETAEAVAFPVAAWEGVEEREEVVEVAAVGPQ